VNCGDGKSFTGCPCCWGCDAHDSETSVQNPGLAVVLVGSRGDSETYVRSKKKACEEVGIKSFGTDLPEDVSQEELLKVCESHHLKPSNVFMHDFASFCLK